MYSKGKFAFSDTTDRGQAVRSEHLRLPPTRLACKNGSHAFSEYTTTLMVEGKQMIRARCPDCKAEVTFPALAKDRN